MAKTFASEMLKAKLDRPTTYTGNAAKHVLEAMLIQITSLSDAVVESNARVKHAVNSAPGISHQSVRRSSFG